MGSVGRQACELHSATRRPKVRHDRKDKGVIYIRRKVADRKNGGRRKGQAFMTADKFAAGEWVDRLARALPKLAESAEALAARVL